MKMKSKLESNHGIALVHVILLVLIILVLGLIIMDGVRRHTWDVCMTFDMEEVDEAIALSKNQYLSDSAAGPVTYYYDAATKKLFNRAQAKNIVGYGRSLAPQNKHSETGAIGIPNLGGKDGAQFLAISFDASGNDVTARWQGHTLTYYDWTIMTKDERDGVTDEEFDSIQATAPDDVILNRKTSY